MKLIIDIHEEQYEFIKQGMSIKRVMEYPALMETICEYIVNGTTLPKGHGRLIDADAYRKEMLDSREFDFFKRLDMQPTIIEADKEENTYEKL